MGIEYYARCDYKYTGDTNLFSVPFSYIDKSHIVVIINDDYTNPSTNFTFITANQIAYTGELKNGDIISIRRTTPLDERFVDFTDGNILDEETQNLSAEQVFDKMQEVTDAQESLLERMTEFLSIKSLVEENLNTLNTAADVAKETRELLFDTKDLVQNISEDYNYLSEITKKGIRCSVNKNLFSLEVTDKVLSEDEKEGLCEQGGKVYAADYETAYTTLVNEFNTGEKQVYTSEDEITYYKAFSGEVTGDFYLPYDKEIEVGQTIYSDTQFLSPIGEILNVEELEVDEYFGTLNTFYVPKNTQLDLNTTVYRDKELQIPLGQITAVKNTTVNKYTASRTGDFYIDEALNIRVGRQIFSDAILETPIGYVTAITNFEADKYSLGGIEGITEFYVPKGTMIVLGTTIYQDKYCEIPIGTITKMGNTQSGTVYEYESTSGGVDLKSISGGRSYIRANPVYSTTPITSSGFNTDVYADSICTKFAGKALIDSGGLSLTGNTYYINGAVAGRSYKVKQIGSGSSYAYMEINNNPTQLSYYKMATISNEVISINDGDNEHYERVNTEITNNIKIADEAYQKYILANTLLFQAIDVYGDLESIEYKGVFSQAGVVFEYMLADNGHKIADVKYKTLVEPLEGFYILDREEMSIILPKLDMNKNIYFVVGNMTLIPASIQSVTKAYLNDTLEAYLKKEQVNYEALEQVMEIVVNFQNEVEQYHQTLDNVEAYLTDIDEELTTLDNLGEEILGEE